MKQLIITFLLLICVSNAYSQKIKEGSFDCIANETKILFVIDFSKGLYKNLDEVDIANLMGNSWEKAKNEITIKFLVEANDKLSSTGLRLGTYAESTANYRCVFIIDKVNKNGDNSGNIILYPINSDKKIGVISIKGDGGKFGTFANLMGDGMKEAGASFGRFLRHIYNRNH